MKKQIVCGLLVAALLYVSLPVQSMAYDTGQSVDQLWKGKTEGGALPAFGDAANSENVLALLDEYDPDGAYILRKADENFMRWFSSDMLLKQIGTAVHEECHSVIFSVGFALSENRRERKYAYYTGNGTVVPVTFTKVYNTKEMIPYIPAELQTTRYHRYVETSDEDLTSVVNGVYGLMNEYTAYSWDMNNTVHLYDYYKTHINNPDGWFLFVNQGANGRMAYAEFRYFILTYMMYAKDHHPDIYRGIVNNIDFKKAFRLVDTIYSDNIRNYESILAELTQRLTNEGHQMDVTDDQFLIDGSGIGIYGDDYRKLMAAIGTQPYQTELAVLYSN